MSYTTKNGKLAKEMPPMEDGEREIRFHVIATCRVRIGKDGTIGDATLDVARTTTHPDDNLVERDLRIVMEHSEQLSELAGVLLCEQAHRRRNPKIVKPTPALAKEEANGE